MEHFYELQLSATRDRVWLHCSDGSTVARFGRQGIDLHNSVSEQMEGASQCRLCTHGATTAEDWEVFRARCLEWWGVDIPADAIDPKFFAKVPVHPH